MKSVLCLILIQFLSLASQAGLGEKESSIDQDVQTFSNLHYSADKKTATSPTASYHVVEIKINITTIKEYIDNNGNIFAITWRGKKHPDLSLLLATHYSEFNQKLSEQPRTFGRHPVTIKTSHAIITRGGHMRDFFGKAYLPENLPAGVNAGDLL